MRHFQRGHLGRGKLFCIVGNVTKTQFKARIFAVNVLQFARFMTRDLVNSDFERKVSPSTVGKVPYHQVCASKALSQFFSDALWWEARVRTFTHIGGTMDSHHWVSNPDSQPRLWSVLTLLSSLEEVGRVLGLSWLVCDTFFLQQVHSTSARQPTFLVVRCWYKEVTIELV